MKRILVLLLSCVAAIHAAEPKAAAGSRTVYLLPMGFGFDQFLANHLRATGLFDVVTDPRLAETVLTDRIGAGFEAQMQRLFGEKTPPPPAKEEKEKAKDEAAGPDFDARSAPVGMMSTFGRGKGNLFLVDVKSSQVVWSTYERPPGSDSVELDRAAQRIAERLKRDMLKAKSARAAAAPAPPEPGQ